MTNQTLDIPRYTLETCLAAELEPEYVRDAANRLTMAHLDRHGSVAALAMDFYRALEVCAIEAAKRSVVHAAVRPQLANRVATKIEESKASAISATNTLRSIQGIRPESPGYGPEEAAITKLLGNLEVHVTQLTTALRSIDPVAKAIHAGVQLLAEHPEYASDELSDNAREYLSESAEMLAREILFVWPGRTPAWRTRLPAPGERLRTDDEVLGVSYEVIRATIAEHAGSETPDRTRARIAGVVAKPIVELVQRHMPLSEETDAQLRAVNFAVVNEFVGNIAPNIADGRYKVSKLDVAR